VPLQRLMSGQPISLTTAEWNGSNAQTGTAGGQCHSPDPLRISSGRSRKRNGRKPSHGQICGSLGRIPTLLAGEGASETWPSSGEGQQTASGENLVTSCRPVIVSLASTSSGRRVRPQPRVGGACTIPKPGTTFSRIAPTGRPSRRSCGRQCGRRRVKVKIGSRSVTPRR